jgi:hypothetical protein
MVMIVQKEDLFNVMTNFIPDTPPLLRRIQNTMFEDVEMLTWFGDIQNKIFGKIIINYKTKKTVKVLNPKYSQLSHEWSNSMYWNDDD